MTTTFLVAKNNAFSHLASALAQGVTSLTVTTGEGANFPSTYPFHLTIDDEIVSCTNRATDTLTIVRAQQSTVDAPHANSRMVALNITAKAVTDLNTAVNTIEDEYIHKDGSVAFIGSQEFHAPVIMTSSLAVAGAAGFGAPVLMHSSLGVAGTTTLALAIVGGGLYVAGIANLPATIINSTLGVAGVATLASLAGVGVIDATTENTIEAAIDTLANLVSVQGHTVTLTGDFIRSGAHSLTLITTATTSVTLPTTGTLATLAGTEELDNKTLDSSVAKGTWTASGTWVVPAFQLNGVLSSSDANGITLRVGTADGTGGFIALGVGGTYSILLATPNAAGNGNATRLIITGDLATGVATWSNVTHTGLVLSGALNCGDQSLTDVGNIVLDVAATYAIELSGTINSGVGIYGHHSQTSAFYAGIWYEVTSTVTSGDVTSIRGIAKGNAASSGANVRGGYFEAKMGGASKYAAMLEGALIHADYSAGSATISGDVRGLTVQISTGASLTAANLYGILLNIQTRGSESGLSDDVGLMIRNEAVGGNGRTMDAALKITDLNMGGGTNGFYVGISFAGITCSTAEIDLDFGKIIFDQDGDTDIHCDTDDELDFKLSGSNFVIMSAGVVRAGTTNQVDLGSASKQFKDLYVDGVAYIDSFGDSPYFPSVIFIGDANTTADSALGITAGIQIDMGDADDAVLVFRSSDVAHGCTDQCDTDTYAYFKKNSAAQGGLFLAAYRSTGVTALKFRGLTKTVDTTKSTSANAAIQIQGGLISGTSGTVLSGNANLVEIDNYGTVRWIVDAEGDTWQGGRITVGGATVLDYIQDQFNRAFTSGGSATWATKFYVAGALTGVAGDTAHLTGVNINPDIITQTAEESIGYVASLRIDEPNITDNLTGAGVITVAAALYIRGAPTEGVTNAAIYVSAGKILIASADPLQLGVAGSTTGTMNIQGATSGVVTVTVNATAGTWTMTLPAAVGTAGFQLTDAGGNGITSWAAAASLREYKNIICEANPQDALDAILKTRAYRFHYKEGFGTQDALTEYVGVMADEAAWAMHYNGGVVNPVNTLGYMVLGFQAMDARLETVEQKIKRLESELAELKESLI